MIKKRKKFIRRNWDKYKRLRRKLVWRRPRGRHAKMRERRKGYPSRPEVGMRKAVRINIKLISNMKELLMLKKNEEVVLAKIGKRKRQEIEKKAKEMNVKILNLKKGTDEPKK